MAAQKKRLLIVNADDCNLTPGVTEAILDCHECGIVSSTTVLINMPADPGALKEVAGAKRLGVGLHLNITFGPPVSSAEEIPSLVSANGEFIREFKNQDAALPLAGHLELEWQRQIDKFKNLFRRNPTHLDTHHQLHDRLFYYEALIRIAEKNRLPVRRSALTVKGPRSSSLPGPLPDAATQTLLGFLNPEKHWTRQGLREALEHLQPGITEVMCHPGRNDPQLRKLSSFQDGR